MTVRERKNGMRKDKPGSRDGNRVRRDGKRKVKPGRRDRIRAR